MAIDVNDPQLKKRKKKVAPLNAQTQTQRRPIRTGPKGGVRQGGRKRLPGGRAAAPQLNAPPPPPTTPKAGIPPLQTTAPPPAPQLTGGPQGGGPQGGGLPAPQPTAPPPAPQTTAPPPAPETTEAPPAPEQGAVDPGTQAEIDILTQEINDLIRSGIITGPRLRDLLLEREELQARGEARQRAFDQEERFRQQLLEQQPAEFEALSSRFAEGLQLPLGGQLAGSQALLAQQFARRGLTGSGLEAAGGIALAQAGQISFATSLAQFQNQLALAQQQEVALTRQGGYDFVRGLENFLTNFDFERKLIEFQNRIANDRSALDRLFQLGAAIGTAGASEFFRRRDRN